MLLEENRPGAESQAGLATGARAFSRLPNEAALTPVDRGGLDAAELILLAYRLTFADGNKPWALREKHLRNEWRQGRLVRGRGLGKNVIRAAIAGLKAKGYIERAPGAKRLDGKWPEVVERLTDRARRDSPSRHVRREWFDGRHSAQELAMVLFLRAHGKAYTREIEKRFGWCRQTVCKVLRALIDQGAALRSRPRGSDGTFAGTTYEATKPASPLASTVKKRGNGKRGNGKRGNGKSGNLRSQSLTNSFGETPNEVSPSRTRSGVRPRASRAADTTPDQSLLTRDGFKGAQKHARANPRLLSWDEGGAALEAPTFDHFDEVQRAVPYNQNLGDRVSEAAQGRVSGEILSPLGLFSIRYLAACLIFAGAESEPGTAVNAILEAVRERIGERADAELSSIGLIGKRVRGSLAEGRPQSAGFYGTQRAADEADADRSASCPAASQLLQRLADADGAQTLAPKLHGDGPALVAFVSAQASEHQQEAIDIVATIEDVLHRHMIDGKRRHSIRSWRYFEGAIADEMGRRDLEARGLRPGDVYCSTAGRRRRNA